jgi:hypothetical protein
MSIGLKIFLMAIKIPNDFKIKQHFLFQGLQKYSQIGTFGASVKVQSGNPVQQR